MQKRGITLLELAFAGTVIFALLWFTLPRLREGVEYQNYQRFVQSVDYAHAGDIDALKAHVKKHGRAAFYLPDAENLSLLHVVAIAGDVNGTRAVLETDLQVDTKTDSGVTPLMYIASGGVDDVTVEMLEAVVRLLHQEGAEIDAADNFGSTALMRAAATDQISIVHYLVSNGANVNARAHGSSPSTPLSSAVTQNQEEVVAYLLDHGAHVNQTDIGGRHVLQTAAFVGNETTLGWILERVDDVDVPHGVKGRTPIWLAACEGHIACVKLLLDHGADPSSAMDIATRKDDKEILALLRDHEQVSTLHGATPTNTNNDI